MSLIMGLTIFHPSPVVFSSFTIAYLSFKINRSPFSGRDFVIFHSFRFKQKTAANIAAAQTVNKTVFSP